ncbi:MAG: hypothetical protein AB7I38_16740 [Dehalococcoidia bacterium]
MGATHIPQGPDVYDFAALDEGRFEELCHILIADEYKEAQRLRPPDGGLDVVLMEGGTVARGWQVKRFTGRIHWTQCVESLDTAVRRHEARWVTFCFARDLTVSQKAAFTNKLVGRHRGVKVDFWTAGTLTARLLRASNSRQIARRFFAPADSNDEILRTVRAGGPIRSLVDIGDRAGSLANVVGEDDPRFAYVVAAGPGAEGSWRHPATTMSMGGEGPEGPFRVDAVPRGRQQLGIQVRLDAPADSLERRTLVALLRHGGEAHFEKGLSLRLSDGPKLFGDELERARDVSWTIRTRPIAKPWASTLRAVSASGQPASFPLDLAPRPDAPAGYTAALSGSRGGLELVIGFRWELPDGPGSMGMRWNFILGGHSVSEQRSALAFLQAMTGSGRLEILDRTGGRPPMRGLEIVASEDDRELLAALGDLLEDLALVEEWSGNALLVPSQVSEADAAALFQSARAIRDGSGWVRVESWALQGPRDQVRSLVTSPPLGATVPLPLQLTLGGQAIDLGAWLVPVPPCRIVSEEVLVGPGDEVRLQVQPLSGAPVRAVLRRPKGGVSAAA